MISGEAGLMVRRGRTKRQAGINFETDDHPETIKILLEIRTGVFTWRTVGTRT